LSDTLVRHRDRLGTASRVALHPASQQRDAYLSTMLHHDDHTLE
jgi:hypothetical protein